MELINLCQLCDQYEIVDTKPQLDRDYYSHSNSIYSDGRVISHINSEGYIHITNVEDADYIMFAGINHAIYLGIYKYTPEVKYKEILDRLNRLKNMTAEMLEENINNNVKTVTQNTDLVDINNFACDQCGYIDKLQFTRSPTNPDALICKCNQCKSEYTLVPSRYYRISSKKIVYFKSEDSRDITISEKKTSIVGVQK